MTSIYEPPTDPEERLIEIALDSWVNYSRWILWLCGIIYLLLGLAMGPIATAGIVTDPTMPQWLSILILVGSTLFTFLICGTIGIINLAAANGLGRGSKWSWYVTLILGGLYLPICCGLFGAILLYAMLNDKTRKLFLNQ